MPLLCISLLVPLLLPLSMSLACEHKSPTEVSKDYKTIEAVLKNTIHNITTLLRNSSVCLKMKYTPHSCASNNTDLVQILHTLHCDMMYVGLPETKFLGEPMGRSVMCRCRRNRTQTPDRRGKGKIRRRCKVKMILSSISHCYMMLNAMVEAWGQIPASFFGGERHSSVWQFCVYHTVLRWIMQYEASSSI